MSDLSLSNRKQGQIIAVSLVCVVMITPVNHSSYIATVCVLNISLSGTITLEGGG